MIRIRFHGRGGHGVKTASRIVGTAAFLSGFEVQDSPIYGAERRGAPVTAFTRISDERILERGVIERPDLIVVGDETLLEDPAANTLSGHSTAAAIFVNAERGAAIAQGVLDPAKVESFDLARLTLDRLGKASALSTGLAAVAAKLVGVCSVAKLEEAIREELASLGVPGDTIEKNVELAKTAYESVPTVELIRPEGSGSSEPVHRVGYEGPARGSPSILAPGNARLRNTGSWRVDRPEIDRDQCTRCALCLTCCPEGAITLDDEGYPVIDYDHCKGCMICLERCPLRAVAEVKEVRSW